MFDINVSPPDSVVNEYQFKCVLLYCMFEVRTLNKVGFTQNIFTPLSLLGCNSKN
jgi:hypothetical protein